MFVFLPNRETMCFALIGVGNTEDSVFGEVLLTCVFMGCTFERALICARGELPSVRILTHSCMVEGLLSFIYR